MSISPPPSPMIVRLIDLHLNETLRSIGTVNEPHITQTLQTVIAEGRNEHQKNEAEILRLRQQLASLEDQQQQLSVQLKSTDAILSRIVPANLIPPASPRITSINTPISTPANSPIINTLVDRGSQKSSATPARTTPARTTQVPTSLINKLPSNVLAAIFIELNLEPSGDEEDEPGIYIREGKTHIPALVVGLVCKRWWNVVEKTSDLWNIMSINGRKLDRSSRPMLQSLLNRSGIQPLYISLQLAKGQGPLALVPLLQSSYRWESFDFAHTEADLPLVQTLEGQFSKLKELGLYMLWQSYKNPPLTIFRTAPSLRKLTLWLPFEYNKDLKPSAYGDKSLGIPELPFEQLKELTLRVHNMVQFFRIVTHCPKLQVLELELSTKTEVPGTYKKPICLPQVHTLFIVVGEYRSKPKILSALFRYLTLPVLKCLKICVDETKVPIPVDDFKQMQARSKFNLTDLILATHNAEFTNIHSFLEALPSLANLTLHDLPRNWPGDKDLDRTEWSEEELEEPEVEKATCLVSADLFTALRFHPLQVNPLSPSEIREMPLLPHLETLSLNTFNDCFPPEDLVNMLSSRAGFKNPSESPDARSALKSAELRFTYELDSQSAEELEDLRSKGLHVNWELQRLPCYAQRLFYRQHSA